jgi:hypothetical protein
LDIIQKILNVSPHPFYNEFVNHKGDAKKFSIFVKDFLENFDYNYDLCKKWIIECHTSLISKIENENSFLEIIGNGIKISNKSLL